MTSERMKNFAFSESHRTSHKSWDCNREFNSALQLGAASLSSENVLLGLGDLICIPVSLHMC